MLKIIKKTFLLAIVISGLAILSACGQGTPPELNTTTTTTSSTSTTMTTSTTTTTTGAGATTTTTIGTTSSTTTTTTSTSSTSTTTTTTTTSTTTTTLAGGSGTTYYVATTGNDSTGTGSSGNPWATPGYGTRQLQAGDTLIIGGGTYIVTRYEDDIIIPQNSGSAGNPITIQGEVGNRPVLAARMTSELVSGSTAGLGRMVDLNSQGYITIKNIEFTHDSTVSGINLLIRDCITGNSDHITLENLYIHHIDNFGINIQDVDTLTVQSCTIEYCGFGAIGSPDLGAGGGWKNITIDSCDLSYNGHYYQGGNDARGAYDRPDGIGLEEGPGPIEVSNCLVEHNYGDGIDIKTDNAYVHENLVRNNTANGIKIWGGGNDRVYNNLVYGTGDGAFNGWDAMIIAVAEANTTVELINNTVHDIGTRSAYSMIVQYDPPYNTTPITLTMKNNIFSNSNGEVWLSGSVTPIFQNNLFNRDNNTSQLTLGGTGYTYSQINSLANCSGNITGDPLFVNPVWGGSNGDYTLQSSSPAIDSGTSSGAPTIDITGASRPQGSGYDMGAYEQ